MRRSRVPLRSGMGWIATSSGPKTRTATGRTLPPPPEPPPIPLPLPPPGARGLLMLPYFSGERTPIHDPLAKGALFGLNMTHTRGDIYRALLEGIAFGTAHVTETFAEAGATPTRILAVGGGVNNEIWLQATSDISGVPQIICDKTIGASYGDAFLAACAVGAAEPGDIDLWNPMSRRVEPSKEMDYSKQFELFKDLYTATRDIAHALP